jgi:hypothetical protein
VSWSAAGSLLAYAQHIRCCKSIKRCALGFEFPWASGAAGSIPCSAGIVNVAYRAHAAEDGERIGRLDLVDELAARLDLAVQAVARASASSRLAVPTMR